MTYGSTGSRPELPWVLGAKPAENMDAYQAYLQGMSQLHAPDFSLESFDLGVRMFERAVTLDPDFALLYLRWRGDTAAARDILEVKPAVGNSESCRVGFDIELLDRRYPAAIDRLVRTRRTIGFTARLGLPMLGWGGIRKRLSMVGGPLCCIRWPRTRWRRWAFLTILTVAWLEKDPRWDLLRGDEGFAAIIDRYSASSQD